MKPRPTHQCECGSHLWFALTQGFVGLVSPEDRDKVEGRNWHAAVNGVAPNICVYAIGTGKMRLHRILSNSPDGEEVDHVNNIGVDNQRGNLRPSTGTQNQYNVRKRKGVSSRFKGVSWYSSRACWLAKIYIKGRVKHLGYFKTEEEASAAYEMARLDIVRFEPTLAVA